VRKPYLAGNWKMNLELKSALGLAGALREHVGSRDDVDVGVAPPYVYLSQVIVALEGSPIRVGAQDVCDRTQGAFTGEVSAMMLKDIGCDFSVVGHSERRRLYGEGDELCNTKVHRALEAGLEIILCVGETLDEREAGKTETVVRRQLSEEMAGVLGDQLDKITLAYEPVWAIGTGRTATPEQAGEVHRYLRGMWAGLYDEQSASRLRIQYGGSVKPSNAKELLAIPDIDGALVGGAALTPEQFQPIIDSAS
jgi:triosephosphate isomerase